MQDARIELGDTVTSKPLRSQIEIASPILHSHVEACEVMSRTRRVLGEGTSAHRQLKIHNDSRAAGDDNRRALAQVIDWLKATTRKA